MVVEDLLRLSAVLKFAKIESVALFSVLRLIFIRLLLLSIGNNLFPISVDRAVTSINLFLQAVIKASFPDVDNLVRSPRNEVVALPAEFGSV
jgi:hypothetical protein